MITNGKVVNLGYKLKNAQGAELDSSGSDQPFVYLHGAGQIVPGLESALEGLKTGDKKSVTVAPKDGYGEVIPELKMSVDRSLFPQDRVLQPGMQFAASVGDGQSLMFTVEAIEGDKVRIDGNHPLAGETLYFDVEILGVRDATEDELDHGHAHGEGGHDH